MGRPRPVCRSPPPRCRRRDGRQPHVRPRCDQPRHGPRRWWPVPRRTHRHLRPDDADLPLVRLAGATSLRRRSPPTSVAYWFNSSTSFANPAVSVTGHCRTPSPVSIPVRPMFIVMQFAAPCSPAAVRRSIPTTPRPSFLMSEFVVVRHGRPLTERLESGIADPSLDEFGRWQAERVCAWLAHSRSTLSWRPCPRHRDRAATRRSARRRRSRSSPISTRSPASRRSTSPPTCGRPRASTSWRRWAGEALRRHRLRPARRLPQRIANVWRELVADPPGEHVVIGCHGGTIREIIGRPWEMPASFHAQLEYASICRFAVTDGRVCSPR